MVKDRPHENYTERLAESSPIRQGGKLFTTEHRAYLDTAPGAPVSDPAAIEEISETRRTGDRRSAMPVKSGAVSRCARTGRGQKLVLGRRCSFSRLRSQTPCLPKQARHNDNQLRTNYETTRVADPRVFSGARGLRKVGHHDDSACDQRRSGRTEIIASVIGAASAAPCGLSVAAAPGR